MLFGKCPNRGGDKLKGASLRVKPKTSVLSVSFSLFLSENIMLKVWVSCASVRLVRANDDAGNDEGPVYTDEEYEELAASFG